MTSLKLMFFHYIFIILIIIIIFFSNYHVCFLRWISSELKSGKCMSFRNVNQSVKTVDFFSPRVDVVLDNRLIIGDQ